jgi:PAS domain S-box-containing protein
MKTWYKQLSFRIWLPFALLIVLLSMAMGFYFPSRQSLAILDYRGQELSELSRSLSLGMEIALVNEDFSALDRVMQHARSHDDLSLTAVIEIDSTGTRSLFITEPSTLPDGVDALRLDTTEYLIRSMPFSSSMMNGEVLVALSYAYINDEVRDLNFPLYAMITGSILVTLIFAFPVARLISRPIESLTRVASAMESGNYDLAIPSLKRGDEIASLSKALEALRVALIDQKAQNEAMNQGLSDLVEERTAELDRLSMVARNTDNGVIITDVNQNIEWVNEAMCRLSGYNREEIIGNSPRMFQFEQTDSESRKTIREALKRRRPVQVEIQNRDKYGEPYWVGLYIQPIIDRKGDHQGYMSVEVDVTQRKLFEEQQDAYIREIEVAKKQVEQLNTELNTTVEELITTNSELDRFVYSTSHDLRAPILSVIGLVDLCSSFYPDDEELHESFRMMRQGLVRSDEAIRAILEYSKNRRLDLEPVPLDVHKLVGMHLENIGFMPGISDVRFEVDIDPEARLFSDRSRVMSIINNLITNAAKYQRPSESDKYVKISYKATPKGGIFEVKDNGEGIPLDRQKKIFGMFVRNSSVSTGSGLGLYITQDIVKRLGGEINLVSEEGKGSVFSVTLPHLVS